MPRKIPSAQAELRARLAELSAQKAAQRASEAPIRLARRKLMGRVSGLMRKVDRYNLKISRLIHDRAFGALVYEPKLAETEHVLADATARFNSALLDLKAFDALHNIHGAAYPQLPELDLEATVAAGIQERARMTAEIKVRVEEWKRGLPVRPPRSSYG